MAESVKGHPMFRKLTEEEIKLHDEKNEDYAKGSNPLGNFYRVSEVLTSMGFPISPTMVCIVYAMKQLDAAVHMLTQGYEGEVENVDTRLRDVHVYFKLARILHMEEQESLDTYIEPWYETVVKAIECCPVCIGTGRRASGDVCSKCNGAKVIPID